MVHVDLIDPYIKSIRQHQPGGATIKSDVSLPCMTMINPVKTWFEIAEVPTLDLDEVTGVNYEYSDKLSTRVSQLFSNT